MASTTMIIPIRRCRPPRIRSATLGNPPEYAVLILKTLQTADIINVIFMRNRYPHRENVENILAISLAIMTMQHIRESPSASHAMRKSAWNELDMHFYMHSVCELGSVMPGNIYMHLSDLCCTPLQRYRAIKYSQALRPEDKRWNNGAIYQI